MKWLVSELMSSGICITCMNMLFARNHVYDIVWPANPGRSDAQKKTSHFPYQGACTH